MTKDISSQVPYHNAVFIFCKFYNLKTYFISSIYQEMLYTISSFKSFMFYVCNIFRSGYETILYSVRIKYLMCKNQVLIKTIFTSVCKHSLYFQY